MDHSQGEFGAFRTWASNWLAPSPPSAWDGWLARAEAADKDRAGDEKGNDPMRVTYARMLVEFRQARRQQNGERMGILKEAMRMLDLAFPEACKAAREADREAQRQLISTRLAEAAAHNGDKT